MATIIERQPVNVPIDGATKKALRAWMKGYRTREMAAGALGVNVKTLRDALDKKTCHPNTLQKIKAAVNAAEMVAA